MKTPLHLSITGQEKEELMEDVAQVERLAASIRARMKRLHGDHTHSIVTSITARMKRLEMPDAADD